MSECVCVCVCVCLTPCRTWWSAEEENIVINGGLYGRTLSAHFYCVLYLCVVCMPMYVYLYVYCVYTKCVHYTRV